MNIVPRTTTDVKSEKAVEERIIASIEKMHSLWIRKLRLDVECAFEIGDEYEANVVGNNRAINMIVVRYGQQVHARWLEFRRIAVKWNKEQRKAHSNKPWTWFRNNNVSGPDVKKEKEEILHEATAADEGDDDWHICTMIGKKEVWIRVPKSMLDKVT